MGEHISEQMKTTQALSVITKLRLDEPPLGTISLQEQNWLARAFDCLQQIYAQRIKGRPGDSAYCIFEFGDAYVQFRVPFDQNQLVCEAVSAKSNPELSMLLTARRRVALSDWLTARLSETKCDLI
jgi:hypothetical protein